MHAPHRLSDEHWFERRARWNPRMMAHYITWIFPPALIWRVAACGTLVSPRRGIHHDQGITSIKPLRPPVARRTRSYDLRDLERRQPALPYEGQPR